jgi:two-component system, sensor histidine kinase
VLADNRDMLLADQMESVVLRESIRARTSVAPVSMLTTVSLNLLYIPFFLLHQVPYPRIISWSLPIILLIVARGAVAMRILKRLDQCNSEQLCQADRVLRVSSIANQVTVGLGVWIVRVPGDDSMVVPMFMTLLVVCWSIGVMANLFSDYRSFIVSMPLMVGLNALFWVMHSAIGVTIGLSLALASLFMVFLVRSGTRIFRESILIRFEKDRLVSDLELERENTQKALRDAQAANESKAFFMAAASHDIKQPLHALSLLTDTLLMSDPPESTVPLLKSQKEGIARMTEHFDALMDMGRFQDGRFEPTPTRFRLGAFAMRIDAEIAPQCAEKGLTWTLLLHDVLVTTDEELLLRVLRNLLTNAVRFTEIGEVRCITQKRGERVEFIISDTGCGIPPEHHAEVFREFVRLPQKGVQLSGAGLGLSIVAKINQTLGLGLHMSSTVGVGTQLTFTLPAAAEDDSALATQVLPHATGD